MRSFPPAATQQESALDLSRFWCGTVSGARGPGRVGGRKGCLVSMHRPLRAFFMLSLPFFALGLGLGLRWLFFYFTTTGPTGHVQSLIVAAISAVVGVQIVLFGLLGDLLATNRRLSEELLFRAA